MKSPALHCFLFSLLLTSLVVASAACGAETGPSVSTSGEAVAVVQALDGDSLVVDVAGVEAEVRLLGINAPERDECFDDEARSRLAELAGDRVQLTGEDRDRFGRLLRYVIDGTGRVINRQLIAEGMALAVTTDHGLVDEFKQAEEAAFEARVGRWRPDACGPATATGLVISGLEPDAPGDDAANPNGEWVELANRGTTAADLTAWTVQDESSTNRFVFPSGFSLGAGEQVRVFSGCGAVGTSNDALYWCDGDPVWTNRGDTAYLLDASGNVVDRRGF